MSIYIGDNADCLAEGRLSCLACLVCALCLPYVWPVLVCGYRDRIVI